MEIEQTIERGRGKSRNSTVRRMCLVARFSSKKKKIDGRDEFQAVISLFCATFNRESAESLIISFIL